VNCAAFYECGATTIIIYAPSLAPQGQARTDRVTPICHLFVIAGAAARDLCMRPLRRSVNYRLWRRAATISTSKPQTRRSLCDVHAHTQPVYIKLSAVLLPNACFYVNALYGYLCALVVGRSDIQV
jgi:hypothetical protein